MGHRIIDLKDFSSPGVTVFAGRQRGEAARARAALAVADAQGDTVEVRIPEDTISVNTSFFLGMFADSIRQVGEAEFRRRYVFVGPRAPMVLEDGIKEALLTSSPLVATGEHPVKK